MSTNSSFLNRHHRGTQTYGPFVVPPSRLGHHAIFEAIISSPVSELNIFDLSLSVEAFEKGAWRVKDQNQFPRTLEDGPRDAITISMYVRLQNLVGDKLRVIVTSGQSFIGVAGAFEWL